MILGFSILAGLVTLTVLFRLIFRDWDDFCECVVYSLKPDVYSWLQGDLEEDWWAEMRMYVWIGVSVAVGYGTHIGLSQWLRG